MISPYYSDGSVTIYNGDAFELSNDVRDFDILMTDPPYGMMFRSNHRAEKHKRIHGDDSFPVGFVMSQVSRAKFASYVFCRWNNIPQMPTPKSCLCWVKNNWSMGDLEHEHGRQWEACLFYNGPQHCFTTRIPDVIFADRTGNNLHPTEKPINLIQKILSSNAGDLVFDPFSGSGTTGVAAKNIGKKAILIEIDEKYCEIAAKRLSQEVLQL